MNLLQKRSALLLIGLGLATPAVADTVTLKDGREIHGRLVEETKDRIVLRIGSGQMPIEKSKIATFTENADWGDDQGGHGTPTPQQPAEPDQGQDTGDTGTTGGDTGTTGGATGGSTAGGAEDWTWPRGLSRKEIQELTKVRDQLLAEQKDLGLPTKDRVALIDESKLSAGEQREIKDLLIRMGFNRQQRSSANMVRRGARERLVSTYGVRAIPALLRALDGNDYWQAREATAAVQQMSSDPDAKWYFYYFDVPSKLIKLMGHQGEFGLSPFMRKDANSAMKALTGQDMGFQASDETLRTDEEDNAIRRWRDWWRSEQNSWKAEEEKKEARRQQIADGLAQLRKGEMPGGMGGGEGSSGGGGHDFDDPLGH